MVFADDESYALDKVMTDLDAAQLAKIDYTLRKVRLQPGERLLDIGCGWGALVIRAAQRFGAQALGITLSQAQPASPTACASSCAIIANCAARRSTRS